VSTRSARWGFQGQRKQISYARSVRYVKMTGPVSWSTASSAGCRHSSGKLFQMDAGVFFFFQLELKSESEYGILKDGFLITMYDRLFVGLALALPSESWKTVHSPGGWSTRRGWQEVQL
jgi:hypothetical protein